MSTTNIDIPLIFDMSGNATVFGEEYADDIVTNHIKLKINASSSGNNKSINLINAFKRIYYTDASELTESNGVLFYKDFADDKTGEIGSAIQDLLFNSENIIHYGSDPSDNFAPVTGPSGTFFGIPIGAKQNVDDPSGSEDSYYNIMFIDNIGTQFHKILIRIACIHLMGQPFSQAFIRENSVENDLKNCDLSKQIIESFELNTLNTVAGPSGSVVDISLGKQNNVLQTIYEQLLRVNNYAMGVEPDISNSSDEKGVLRELSFREGNIVTFYIRPRLFLVIDASLGSEKIDDAIGSNTAIKDSSSSNISINKAQTAANKLFDSIFSTNSSSANPIGYKWLVGRGTPTDNAKLNQWQTNLTKAGVQTQLNNKGASSMFDGHIWKIEVEL